MQEPSPVSSDSIIFGLPLPAERIYVGMGAAPVLTTR
jgi:hypothetical protein